jgi:hypothetical protein
VLDLSIKLAAAVDAKVNKNVAQQIIICVFGNKAWTIEKNHYSGLTKKQERNHK